jgi:hypothetical protein
MQPNSLLKKFVFCRRRGDESQISSGFGGEVRDSLRRLLLFQQAAKGEKPTGVGTCSSAISIYVASRRWFIESLVRQRV